MAGGSKRARRVVWRGRMRRAAAGMHAGVAVALAVALTGLLHVVASRHARRWDVSRARIHSISDKTRAVLAALDRDVEATIFFEGGHEHYHDVDTLLREYAHASPRFSILRVDPDRDPGRAEDLVRRFPVTERNGIIFHSGDRSRVVRAADLADYEETGPDGGRRRMTAFHGESLFTSAVLQVTQGHRPRVAFLTGHGEKSPDATEASASLSTLGRLIRQDNIRVDALSLPDLPEIPGEIDVLIVAGPRYAYPRPLLARIEAWLEQRGRAIFLLDSGVDTGLEGVLASLGLRLDDDMAMDPQRTVTGREVLVLHYDRSHPITERLQGVTSVFYQPRTVEPAQGNAHRSADRPRVTRLAMTSDAGWAERDYRRAPFVFDPGRDRPGPVSLAAAVERGAVEGVDVELRPGRWVVFGDSSFVADGRMTGGNSDLFLGALNWLLDRDEMVAIAPRSVETIRLPLSASQLRLLGWLAMGVLPGSIAVLGLLVRLRRRR